MMDLFLKNTQLFTSQDGNLMDWNGVDYLWIIVMFLSAVLDPNPNLFWRHPLTAEDPLVNKWCNAKFIQLCPDTETNLSIAWRWVHF